MNARSMVYVLMSVMACCLQGCSKSASSGAASAFETSKRKMPELVELGDRIRSDRGPHAYGNGILSRIEQLPETDERLRLLQLFCDFLLAVRIEGDDFQSLYNQFRTLCDLHASYLFALQRCGGEWRKVLSDRLAFLERIRKDMMAKNVLPDDEKKRHAELYMPREAYFRNIRQHYETHLRWLEEAFNSYVNSLHLSADEVAEIRRKIEASIGRNIRSKAEIRYDRDHRGDHLSKLQGEDVKIEIKNL